MSDNKENHSFDQDSVAYIHSERLVNELDKISQIQGRAKLVNSLINAYGLFNSKSLKIVNPFKADEKLLRLFHSQEYISTLKRLDINEDSILSGDDEAEEFGLGYDCPLINNIYDFISAVAGGSLTAAHLINNGSFRYVINWFGGWHHAKREKAGGFCYVNDIVLCISKLRQRHDRVLYVDLDMHHGDGVQDAFEYTDKVMTFDMHKFMPGFYPGTGSVDDCGKGNGKYHAVNVPLVSGINDEMFFELFSKIFNKIIERYQPQVIVVQCGADSLYGDPIDLKNQFNLSTSGYCACIDVIIEKAIPTIFLGGGGYNFSNAARLWCSITAQLTKQKLCRDIPEHNEFLSYGPSYELASSIGVNTPNKNTDDYARSILDKCLSNLDLLESRE